MEREREDCVKYRMDYKDSPIGLLFWLALVFVGLPMFVEALSAETSASLLWRLILAVFGPLSLVMLIVTTEAYEETSVDDPNVALQRCREEWEKHWPGFEKGKSEIEKLEVVYSVAVERTYQGFKYALLGWIISGVGLTIIEYGLLSGNINPSWVTSLSVVLYTIAGFIDFILMIWAYLRYRKYNKQLFAIQLKKSDKAEISIRI